jgi:hypothetical protein
MMIGLAVYKDVKTGESLLGNSLAVPLSTIFQIDISRQSVLLVEETRVPSETQRPTADKLYRVHLAMSVIRTHNVNGDRHWLHTVRLGTYSVKSSASCMSDIQCQAFIGGS